MMSPCLTLFHPTRLRLFSMLCQACPMPTRFLSYSQSALSITMFLNKSLQHWQNHYSTPHMPCQEVSCLVPFINHIWTLRMLAKSLSHPLESLKPVIINAFMTWRSRNKTPWSEWDDNGFKVTQCKAWVNNGNGNDGNSTATKHTMSFFYIFHK